MAKKNLAEIPPKLQEEPAKLLTIKQAAAKLECSESWLYKMVEWGQIECRRMGLRGRMIRFDPEHLRKIAPLCPSKRATP